MFYGSFGTQNSMVTFIFKFDPRKGQLHVKLGQIRSNFKIQDFLIEICLSCAHLSQDSKNVIYFYLRQLEMPKVALKNVISSSRSAISARGRMDVQRDPCISYTAPCTCQGAQNVSQVVLYRLEGILCRSGSLLRQLEGLLHRPQGLLHRSEGLLLARGHPKLAIGPLYGPEGLQYGLEGHLFRSGRPTSARPAIWALGSRT